MRLAALSVVGLLVACGEAPAPPPPAAPPPSALDESAFLASPDGCVDGVVGLGGERHAGMSLAHNYQHGGSRGYGTSTSRATLRELSELGVRWVSLTPFGFSRALDATEVRLAATRPEAENDVRLETEIRAAHELGMHVFLKPHVWIAGGAWRGRLEPTDWGAWFASYRAFIVHYAEIAARLDVELLAIGCEFPTEDHADGWRDVVSAVRAVYDGELTFAANWDAVDDVPFWSELDYVGVQLYPPLAREPGTDERSMRGALDRHLDGLEATSARVGRPVILTEVGYKSIEGTEIHPHTWPERHGRPVISEAAQARAYRRLFAALDGREAIQGLYLWKWFTDPRSNEEGDDGFSPRGKLAEGVVRSAYLPRCRR